MTIPKVLQSLFVTLVLMEQFQFAELIAGEHAANTWLIGQKFRQELDRPFSVNSSRTELREILRQVKSDRRVSVVLDRRLDPSIEFPVEVKNASLQLGLSQIVSKVNGEATSIENTVFLGPKSATTRLRTLIELRRLEISAKESAIPNHRRSELQKRRTIGWKDLDTPADVLEVVASTFRLKITNATVIPHDLWAASSLPETTATEALSIVLIQFNLTFQWTETGNSIELVPIPDRISVERKIRPKQKPAEAISLIHRRFPDMDVQISNSDIVIRGFIEDYEAASHLLRGDVPSRPSNTELPADLRKQQFTFELKYPTPLIDVIKKLEAEADIRMEYDSDEMKAAGINLEQLVKFSVQNASADEFFKSLFGPARIEFQIDQSTVKLKPRKENSK